MLGQSGGHGRAAATPCGPTHSTRYSSSASVSEPARSTNQQAFLSVCEYSVRVSKATVFTPCPPVPRILPSPRLVRREAVCQCTGAGRTCLFDFARPHWATDLTWHSLAIPADLCDCYVTDQPPTCAATSLRPAVSAEETEAPGRVFVRDKLEGAHEAPRRSSWVVCSHAFECPGS